MTEQIETTVEAVVAPAKLTKGQREFFNVFARGAVAGILGPVLEFKGVEISEEQLAAVIDTIDLTDLTRAIGQQFIARVDFKTIQKVDKFMKSEEFAKVIQASSEVNALVQAELVQAIAPLIPADEPTVAVAEGEEADLAA